jgi:hypothetical protein
MRMIASSVYAACVLLAGAGPGAAAPAEADGAASLRSATLSAPAPERWQGRQHYLFDSENQPDSRTVGSAPANDGPCAAEPVRVRRADGATAVQRIKRCE